MLRRTVVLITLPSVVFCCCVAVSVSWAWEPKHKPVADGAEPMKLDSDQLTESSGLAFSHVDEACFWSHNDSGDKARLIAFNQNGNDCGRATLQGIKANDWEDMASFVDTRPRLLVADVGDNDVQRSSVSLYLFDEPNPKKKTEIHSFQHLVVRYSGGARNCESVAVDVKERRIYLLSKSALVATLSEVPLPAAPEIEAEGETVDQERVDGNHAQVMTIEVQAKHIRSLAIPLATGMDLCPKTGDLWIVNYLQGYRYSNPRRSTLETRLSRIPELIELPKLKQVEAIAVDEQGRVWVTSEGTPAKIQRVLFTE